ncbi:MAG: zinc metalloprotease HtpX [Actinomycetota bacterium]
MKNNMKTVVLLGSLAGLMVVFGQLLGGRTGAIIGFGLAAAINFASYWFSDKIALKMSKAKPVTREEAPALYEIVEDLSRRAEIPMPTLHMVASDQPNAFATGRNPEHAAVAVTEGIMRILTRDELEGVLAHELSHVKNRDILTTSIAAAIAGGISLLATMARWGAIFGGGSNDEDEGGGIAAVLVASIVAPLAAMVVQMAISRSREFQADASGADVCGNPAGLASALRKIEAGAQQTPMAVSPSAAPLFIINPLRGRFAQGAAKMFMTHPPTDERIQRLEAMAHQSA